MLVLEVKMSQAIIEFCEGLKTTLLGIEDRLAKAKAGLSDNASQLSAEAKKHIDEAAQQLEQFKVHAGLMAQAIRAELPERTAAAKEKIQEVSQEAHVALRHAAVFLAEAASTGAAGAAIALQGGSQQAKAFAERLRNETAVITTQPPPA